MKESLRFDAAKNIYDNLKIPSDLSQRIEKEIAIRKVPSLEEPPLKKPHIRLKFTLTAAAACAALLITALNTNAAFAQNAGNLPVVGWVAKVLTLNSYEEKDADKTVKVTLPQVTSEKSTAQKVNQMIEEKSKAYLKEAKERVEEYKRAFLDTGGTEEEFKQKNIEIKVNYDVKYQDDNMVSFVLYGAESWVSAYDFNTFYNINLSTDTELTLEELLGKDYVQRANTGIRKQMAERVKENTDNMYFKPDEGGFQTIDQNTKFYINENKNPVIVFDKYEIAPGSMGMQEFEIATK